ncbi:MAG: NAD-dependent epimerase/dehydratase family protein [bacterium]
MGKFLVTGACGFTGSHAVDVLIEKGEDVRATDLPGADRDFLRKGVEFVPADLTSGQGLDKLVEGVEVIFHTAAVFSFSATWTMLKTVNVEGTENLCRAALDAGVRRIMSMSTIAVYGRPRASVVPLKEDNPKNPDTLYGRSKHEQDETLKKFCAEHGMQCTIIRPGVVYGQRNTYGAADLIFALNRLLFVPVPYNFDFIMPLVHARDVAGATYHLCRRDDAAGEEYHVVDPTKMQVKFFIAFIAAIFGKPTVPVFIPKKLAVSAGNLAADLATAVSQRLTHGKPFIEKDTVEYVTTNYDISCEKLMDTGYEFEYPDTRTGIIETIEWYRKEGWLK